MHFLARCKATVITNEVYRALVEGRSYDVAFAAALAHPLFHSDGLQQQQQQQEEQPPLLPNDSIDRLTPLRARPTHLSATQVET